MTKKLIGGIIYFKQSRMLKVTDLHPIEILDRGQRSAWDHVKKPAHISATETVVVASTPSLKGGFSYWLY